MNAVDDVTQSRSSILDLDRSSPIPLYLQIKRHLIREIARWERRDKPFYTDGELCEMFPVSRMTVRQAVQELVEDGLLRRSRGVGTFVVARHHDDRPGSLSNFHEQWVAQGRPISVDLISYEIQPCPAGIAEDLGIPPNAPVRYIFRTRTAGAVPIAMDYRYLPLNVAERLSQADAVKGITFALRHRVAISEGEICLEATTAGPAETRWLGVPLGAPLMLRRLRYFTPQRQCLVAGSTIFRGDLLRYVMRIPMGDHKTDPLAQGDAPDRVVRLRRELAPAVHGD